MYSCPVCRSTATANFMTVRERKYHRCTACEATFLAPEQLPSPEVERTRYDQHNNDPDDPRYVTFLRRLADPVLERIETGSEGLDFGSGPAPVLADLLRAAGLRVSCFDPFFAPDQSLLTGSRRYNFITCCEVAEHLHHPAEEFERLVRLLRPGGILAVMTEFQTEDERFARWYYREDRTHVVFYRERTLRHLASRLDLEVEVPARNVTLLRKNN
jgi:SAM-dependent methyltransferase